MRAASWRTIAIAVRPAAVMVNAVAWMAALLVPASVMAGNRTPTPAQQTQSQRNPQVDAAVDGVLDLFQRKSIVALGDVHGLAQEDDFYGDLVRDPQFAEQVGNVVVEFGGAVAQDIIDRYVDGQEVPFAELRRVWSDVVGWVPGESEIVGFANFYASVRAANAQLPPERRIKVWLGEPKIDWSATHTFRDVAQLLGYRDEHLFGILDRQILQKHKKALVIVGFMHLLTPGGAGPLSDKITDAFPNSLAIVVPVAGYLEPACNASLLSRMKGWEVPSIATPVEGTWLESRLRIAGCHALLPARTADAVLYLGPPRAFTRSPIEPSLYLDLAYFNEISRRAQCCTPDRRPLNWQQLIRQNPASPKEYGPH